MLMDSVLLVQELSHCYKQMSSERKLDSHIYAVVLLYCLQHSCGIMFSIDEVFISQVVLTLLCVCACNMHVHVDVSICTSIHNKTYSTIMHHV